MGQKYSVENLLKFSDRGASSLATSLLDEIVSKEEANQSLSPLYLLANYKKSGSLIERYLLEGQKELENIATNELRQYLYKDGEGEVMEREDQISKEKKISKSLLEARSPRHAGESLLHVLVLCNTDAHTHIAMFLVELYPALAHDIVEDEEYYGATAMHFAIAYENSKLVRKLVEIGADVHQRANGKFFMPIDQQWPIPRAKTNFEGLSYFGEYPLSWAACCDDEPSYNLLVKHGADPNLQDTFGNNILHVLVIRDKLKMYGYALRHPIQPASDHLCNKFGLTPLTLACKLGRNTIFREMLEFSSLEFWRYSNITCSGYPLNALDSLQPNGRANMFRIISLSNLQIINSALMIILKGNSTEHLDMLEGGVIQRLLEEKWKTFAQSIVKDDNWLVMDDTTSVAFTKTSHDAHPFAEPQYCGVSASYHPGNLCLEKMMPPTLYYAEIATCLGCIGFGIIQQVQEILAQGLLGFLYSLTTSPTKSTFVLSCFPHFVLHPLSCTWRQGNRRHPLGHGHPRIMVLSHLLCRLSFSCSRTNPPKEVTAKKILILSSDLDGVVPHDPWFIRVRRISRNVLSKTDPASICYVYGVHSHLATQHVDSHDGKHVLRSHHSWANIIVALERSIDSKSAREFIQTYSIKMPSSTKDTEVRGVYFSDESFLKTMTACWKTNCSRIAKSWRNAADVRRRYNLFPSKQPTARLRNGKIILEWNPIPAPIYKPLKPPTNPKSTIPNAGFDDLLTQVASASGFDIEKTQWCA
ncbi:transient receptor potential cation channel subfamily V member 5 [Caerostris extrusa]|uniref:Transient receptor potential cation channel subfamily V member 5 n=1 Tax=Caerostris extrusa TaxID=172846 RepID=A0AAV4TR30_CAEEX|nr:transient receptor potential cation channel subfamily V member 5 [Caerostris extrusa]